MNAQIEWAPIGAKWYYSLPDQDGNLMADFIMHESIKDTLIRGKNCKKIKSEQNDIHFMYNENNKIYYEYKGSFKKLMDFSIKESDTIYLDLKARFMGSDNDTILNVKSVVNKIDSLIYDSIVLKEYTLDIYPVINLDEEVYPSPIKYIEKIGFTIDGLIPLIIEPISPAVNNNKAMRCYSDSSLQFKTEWWESKSKDCDYTFTGINNISNEDGKIYPNPAHDYLNLSINTQNTISKILVVNLSGQIVKELNSISNRVYIGDLKAGFYFIFIKNNFEYTYHSKIIKK